MTSDAFTAGVQDAAADPPLPDATARSIARKAGKPATGALDAYADARRVETRAAQGLGPVCDDPVAAAQVAASVGPWLDEQGKSSTDEKGGTTAA